MPQTNKKVQDLPDAPPLDTEDLPEAPPLSEGIKVVPPKNQGMHIMSGITLPGQEEVSQGVRDLFGGDYAKGADEALRGTGENLAPLAVAASVPSLIAAPGATLAALGLGAGGATLGSLLGHAGAHYMDATPEQEQLSSDIGAGVGGLAGGLGGDAIAGKLARANLGPIGNFLLKRLPGGKLASEFLKASKGLEEKVPVKFDVKAPPAVGKRNFPDPEVEKEVPKFRVSAPEKPKSQKEPERFKVKSPEKPKAQVEEKEPKKFSVKAPESPRGTSFIKTESSEEGEEGVEKMNDQKPEEKVTSETKGKEEKESKPISSAAEDLAHKYDANVESHAKKLVEYSKSSGEPLPSLSSTAQERSAYTTKARPGVKVRSHGFSDTTLKKAHEINGSQP